MNMHRLVAIGLLLVSPIAQAQEDRRPYWTDAWRGWHFYEEAEEESAALRTAPRQRPSMPVQPTRRPELAEFERMQADLEESRKVAVARPTEANVRRYMELEAAVVSRASAFADVAQRVAWATPQLDPTLQGRPVNAKALEIFEQQRLTDRSRSIGELGRNHVILFFFRSDCPYCHAFAPILVEFQTRHGIKVEAVSIDGGPIPGFAEFRRDNGIATTLRVGQVPAVYLAQPFTGTITPIGFGVLSEAQLVERIAAVSTPAYQQMLPGAVQQLGAPPLQARLTGAANLSEMRP